MKLLHVVPTYVPAWRHGGPVVSVHGLNRALAARGHQVTVFTTDVHGDGRLDVPLEQPVDVDGVEVVYFPTRPPRRLYRSPAMGGALEDAVGAFDLLHLHSVFLWPTSAAARAAEARHVPYLVAPRGMLVPELVRRRGRLRKLLWIRLVERRTLERAAALHCTTELEVREAARFGLRLPRAFCIPNGVDPAPLRNPEGAGSSTVRGIVDGAPYLLFLGRISWKKGLDRLLAALPRVPEVRLVLAGNDEEGLGPSLRERAAALGVEERLVLTGGVLGADKAALLSSARALVLPSYSENFGNVVLEAMAVGCPAVVTPEVGLAPTVAETGAGLVSAGEPAALAGALRELLADPERRREMGERGRLEVDRRFSWEALAGSMEAAYREVLEGGTAA